MRSASTTGAPCVPTTARWLITPACADLRIGDDSMNMSRTEYSEQFDKERKARVAVSFHKYGSARNNFGEGRVDALATAERCLDAFKRDHNTEHLVDAANYLRCSAICTPCQASSSSRQTAAAASGLLEPLSIWNEEDTNENQTGSRSEDAHQSPPVGRWPGPLRRRR